MSEQTQKILREISQERHIQINMGFTAEHDYGQREAGALGSSAACLALHAAASLNPEDIPSFGEHPEDVQAAGWLLPMYKWDPNYENPRADLVIAAALIVAEIERMDYEKEQENSV